MHRTRILLPVLALMALLPAVGGFAAETAKEAPQPILLGRCTRDSLLQEPYSEWYNKNYEAYTPNAEVIGAFAKVDADYEVAVFFGSWCGDSKREVPRFLKTLDALSFPTNRVSLIAVSNIDSLKKQSPDGAEAEQEIYRVPVFIVKRHGVEVNRIVEFPASSLERDLLQIVSGGEYTPNYQSFPLLTKMLQTGLLSDANVSYRGLANRVRHLVSSEGELNAAAAVLVGRGLQEEAVQVFRMNAYLYPESASRQLELAKALHQAGNNADAERTLKNALELNDDPKRQDDILALWDSVREGLRLEAAAAGENTEE